MTELEQALANQRKRAQAAEDFICMLCAECEWESNGAIVTMKKFCCKTSPLDCGKFKLRGVDVAPVEAPKADENALRVVVDHGAKCPTRAHSDDAGLDLYSPVDAVVFPRWRMGAKNSVIIDTGVHVAIPAGYVGDVKSKSGLMCNDDIITDGTVDSGYTGSIRVKLFNLGVRPVHIKAGQKIAQLVIKKIITPTPVVVDSMEETERGNGGFGSSGKF